MAGRRGRAAAILLALAFLAPRLHAASDVVSEWFRTDPKARAYSAAQQGIVDIFDRVGQSGIPLDLLMDKLREGASKKVPAERLISGLQAEAGRLETAHELLTRLHIALDDPKILAELLRSASLGLLAGLSPGTIEELYAFTRLGGRSASEAAAACDALTQLSLAGSLDQDRLKTLGISLLASRLSAAAFKSIPAFYVRAIARGVGDVEVVERLIVATLDAGGGLVQMETALGQMTRGRNTR